MVRATDHTQSRPRYPAHRRPQPARTPRIRLGLCVLEDRVVPTILVVNATNDEAIDTDGKLSLREAVITANNLTGSFDQIIFDMNVFTAPTTITLTNGPFAVTDQLTISGPTVPLLVNAAGTNQQISIAAGNALSVANLAFANFATTASGAVFTVAANAKLNLANSTFANNTNSSTVGGGVLTLNGNTSGVGSVIIDACTFSGNSVTTTGADGGVIRATTQSSITVTNSTFSNNTAANDGGAIYTGGNVLIVGCTFNGNQTINAVGNDGGAIAMSGPIAAGGFVIRNCTFSANRAGSGGAVFFSATSAGTAVMSNCTFTLNEELTATGSGGAINRLGSAALEFESCIISGNSGVAPATNGPDLFCTSAVTMFNCAVGTATGFTVGTGSGNQFGMPVALAPLADNGGPTPTHALTPGSLAVDAGSNSGSLSFDQRGVGYNRVAGLAVDIGAFEVQVVTPPPQVMGITFNDGAAQRSLVTSVSISFSQPVTLGGGAFVLERTANGTAGTIGIVATPMGNNVVLTFDNTGSITLDPGGSLPDGTYELTIVANNVTDTTGTLDGNKNGIADGSPVDNVTSKLHRLFGDANGDGAITASDFNAFRLDYGLVGASIFDFDNSGSVTAADFNTFRLRYGLSGYAP